MKNLRPMHFLALSTLLIGLFLPMKVRSNSVIFSSCDTCISEFSSSKKDIPVSVPNEGNESGNQSPDSEYDDDDLTISEIILIVSLKASQPLIPYSPRFIKWSLMYPVLSPPPEHTFFTAN